MIFQTLEDQAICAWYDSQSEEFLSTLPGYEDGLTPRQAWAAFIADCTPPATQGAACAVAAPAAPALGVCTLPEQVPPSDMLWRLLTDGYDLIYILMLEDGNADKQCLLSRANSRWALIRAQV